MDRREAIQEAVAFTASHPTENTCTGARIYHANGSSIRTILQGNALETVPKFNTEAIIKSFPTPK